VTPGTAAITSPGDWTRSSPPVARQHCSTGAYRTTRSADLSVGRYDAETAVAETNPGSQCDDRVTGIGGREGVCWAVKYVHPDRTFRR
jgi:hypothetical protein